VHAASPEGSFPSRSRHRLAGLASQGSSVGGRFTLVGTQLRGGGQGPRGERSTNPATNEKDGCATVHDGMGTRGAVLVTIDEGLVLRSQAGDVEAMGQLARQARPLVHRYASRFFSDPTRAEDLAQTALMKAFARVGDVRSPEAFPAWLLRITRNECLNELARQRHPQVPLSVLDERGAGIEVHAQAAEDPEEELIRSQLQELVHRVAAQLPPHYRQTLTMRALEDRSYEEISAALDVPVTVARLWYCRARKRFRIAFIEAMAARRGVPEACQALGLSIARMIEGTLPRGERDRLQGHLADCPVCRQTEEELRNTAFRAPARAWLLGAGLLRLGHPARRAAGLVRRAPAAAARTFATGSASLITAGTLGAIALPPVGTTPAMTPAAVAAPAAVDASPEQTTTGDQAVGAQVVTGAGGGTAAPLTATLTSDPLSAVDPSALASLLDQSGLAGLVSGPLTDLRAVRIELRLVSTALSPTHRTHVLVPHVATPTANASPSTGGQPNSTAASSAPATPSSSPPPPSAPPSPSAPH
jgi:RNA polymerase sigma-70 factor, ECF subfamily